MIQTNVGRLFEVFTIVSSFAQMFITMRAERDQWPILLKKDLDIIRDAVIVIQESAVLLDMELVKLSSDRLIIFLNDLTPAEDGRFLINFRYYDEILSSYEEVRSRLRDHLSIKMVLTLHAKSAEWFKKPSLFGEDVDIAFPSASLDIIEAGNCRALERSNLRYKLYNKTSRWTFRKKTGTR